MLITDINIFRPIQWQALIIDEAHRLKNKSSRLLEESVTLKVEHKVLLTGTPLQNNIEELWTLLNFLDKRKFPSWAAFQEQFGDVSNATQVEGLHGVLRPLLLRRLKEDVEKTIAEKTETIVDVELTTVQKKWYKAIYEKNRDFLNKGGKASNAPSLMNIVKAMNTGIIRQLFNENMGMYVSHRLSTRTGIIFQKLLN